MPVDHRAGVISTGPTNAWRTASDILAPPLSGIKR